jgi:hypothetical protein
MTVLADPVPPETLAAQLGERTRILDFRGVEVHAFAAEEAPDVMCEVGRIREKEFRAVGAGRNLALDLDDLDFGPFAYRQLVAWDPQRRELVAAYRYILCGDLVCDDPGSTDPGSTDVTPEKAASVGNRPRNFPGYGQLRTSRLFDFSETMKREILPYSVELGRSVVNREAAKAIMGLYCAWAGLGALTREYTHLDSFFGNFSVYSSYPPEAIALLVRFLERHHRDPDRLLAPRAGLSCEIDRSLADPFTVAGNKESQTDYDKDYDTLLSSMARLGAAVPPILLSYLGATRNLVYLGAARDDDFGGAVECAILVPLKGLNEKARARFVDSYTSTNPGRFRELRSKESI